MYQGNIINYENLKDKIKIVLISNLKKSQPRRDLKKRLVGFFVCR